MPILKILPDAVDTTQSYVFGNVSASSITANGTNLGTAVAEAFVLANNANKSTTSNTAPSNPKVGDTWFDTVTNVLLRYTNDGVSNNWIDISGPQNSGYIYQTYSITPNTSTINETSSKTVSYTVTTTNTADNTVLYWTNSGTTTADDFSDSVSNGSVTIINNSGTITRTMSSDLATETSETIILSLRTGSNTGPIVAVATTVTVTDSSQSPLYRLFATGSSRNGQLGINISDASYPNTYRSSPVQIGSLTDWYSVKSGQKHVVAIRTNSGSSSSGSLWSWGGNDFGQNATGLNRSSPVQVGALTNWSIIDGGGNSTFAIKNDGSLWSWGNNGSGQLGLNNTSNYSSPKQVGTNTNWSKISIGDSSAAIKTDGTLWLWGSNSYGQLGLGDRVNKSSPTQLGTATNWSKISNQPAFATFFAAIKTDGTLWAWGYNSSGQLGQGNSISRSSPVQIGSDTNWSDVAAGSSHFIALKTNGTLWGVGEGIAITQASDQNVMTQIGTSTDWSKIDAAYRISGAVKTDGSIWIWGQDLYGRTGGAGGLSPTQLGSNTYWNEISFGDQHTTFTTLS